MTAPPVTASPAKTIRLIHVALASGIILFALVAHFFVRPVRGDFAALPPIAVKVLLGLSLAASALSLVMRRRVPRRNTDESADLFWTRAAAPALLTWTPLEGGALLGVVAYMLNGTPVGLVLAAVAVGGMLTFSPAILERA